MGNSFNKPGCVAPQVTPISSCETTGLKPTQDRHSPTLHVPKEVPEWVKNVPPEAKEKIKKEHEKKGKLDLLFLRHMKQTYSLSRTKSQELANLLCASGGATIKLSTIPPLDALTSSDMPHSAPGLFLDEHPTKFDEKLLNGEYTCDMDQQPLGQGAFGQVLFALTTEKHRLGAGKKFAIKKVPNAFRNQYSAKKMLRELQIGGLLRKHPCICGLMDAITQNDVVLLIFEYCESNLRNFLGNESIILTEIEIAKIMKKLLCALKYMHSGGIVHRDIKPENILVNFLQNRELEVKICDFGLARGIEENLEADEAIVPQMTKHVVTRWYRAPEISLQLTNPDNIYAVDLWAMGGVFAELLQMVDGHPAFADRFWFDTQTEYIPQNEVHDKEDKINSLVDPLPTVQDSYGPTSEPNAPPTFQNRSTIENNSSVHVRPDAELSEPRSQFLVIPENDNFSCSSPVNVLSSDSTVYSGELHSGDYVPAKEDEVDSLGNHPTNEDACVPTSEPSNPPSFQGRSTFEVSFHSKNAEPTDQSLGPVLAKSAENWSLSSHEPVLSSTMTSTESEKESGTGESHSADDVLDFDEDTDITAPAMHSRRSSARHPLMPGTVDHHLSPRKKQKKKRRFGRPQKEQIEAIIDFVGPPSDEYLQKILLEATRERIYHYCQTSTTCNWRDEFPTVSDEALDLLGYFLTWEPEQRRDVDRVLAHHFFEDISLGPDEDETKWTHTFPKPIVFPTNDKLSINALRKMIVNEVNKAHTLGSLPIWWQSLNANDRREIVAVCTQATERHGGFNARVIEDVKSKFELTDAQANDLRQIVYEHPAERPTRTNYNQNNQTCIHSTQI